MAKMPQYKGSGNKKPASPETVRVPFFGNADIRPGQEGFLLKDQVYLNGYFEPVKVLEEINYHFIKRPGLSSYLVPSSGVGRGCYNWKQTNKLYSVNGSKIFSGTTDLGVTLTTTTGFVDFAETRPGAATQYLGVNDGSTLFLIASDDSVIVLNNVAITSSSVANPTHIIANNHGLNTGNKIIIRNHAGSTPSINNTIFTITKVNANEFTIPVNVTVGGAGGTIGVFPAPNTGDLHFMDAYWFTLKSDGSVWNCSSDDPTTWPTTSFIYAQMLAGRGIGLAKQDNTLIAFTDKHFQMFYDNANPSGSPLSNIEEAMHQLGCVSPNAIASQEDSVFWVANTQTGGFTVIKLDGTTNLQDIGTPTLNRSLASNFFLTPGGATAIQIVLSAGTTWTVPADFNTHNNVVEAIGGGAGGQAGTSGFGLSGHGGGGGAYTKLVNFDPLGAGSISYTLGAGGGPGVSGTNTVFNAGSVIAQGGNASGVGGNAASCTPSSGAFSGGHGGTGSPGGNGGGGGGAAGKNGIGGDGNTGGVGGTSGMGGQGDGGSGGQGGIAGTPNNNGSNGNPGLEWTTVGSGGGGGGGGQGSVSPVGEGGNGGNGGVYGAGGGGGGSGNSSGTVGGNGANGLIIITYVPTSAASDSTAANGYILRVSGHTFYVLNLVNTKETWLYDQEYKIWVKWQSTTSDIWPVVNAVQFAPSGQPQVLVGQDTTTGKIWQIDPTLGQDNGNNYELRVQTNPLTFGTMKRKFYNNVELIGDVTPSSTLILVSYSDNDFSTFSTPRNFDMSLTRQFSKNWGNSRRRAWRVSYTGSSLIRLYGIEFTLEMEGS